MPRNNDIKKVLVIGSGPIVIGQAAEFDYAGTQACRSLKEEGVEVCLVNSNPATIMTDKQIADQVYIEPLTLESLKEIIIKEKPDSILPTLGGQAVTVRGSLATLHDGTIAGSATNLMDCMRFTVRQAGIPLEEAIMCATANPAKEIGIYDEAGSISAGKRADFVLLNDDLDIVSVYIDGKEISC